MSVRELIESALLLAIGTVIYMIIPGYGAGMKPDIILAMLFIIIMLRPNLQSALVAGLVAGLLAGLTTTFPGGFFPNVVDRLVTSIVVLGLVKALVGLKQPVVRDIVVSVIGTIVSGSVFLSAALLMVGLPAPFSVLFITVVLPATALNTLVVIFLRPVVIYSRNAVYGSNSTRI